MITMTREYIILFFLFAAVTAVLFAVILEIFYPCNCTETCKALMEQSAYPLMNMTIKK